MERVRVPILIATFFVLCLGVLQLVARPTAAGNNCPGSTGCGCSTAYAPVVCGGKCRYTNMCHATCAGWTYKQCKDALN